MDNLQVLAKVLEGCVVELSIIVSDNHSSKLNRQTIDFQTKLRASLSVIRDKVSVSIHLVK